MGSAGNSKQDTLEKEGKRMADELLGIYSKSSVISIASKNSNPSFFQGRKLIQ
jgi:hypothetical protein